MTDQRPSRTRTTAKADTAFRTIGEVSSELGVPQHVLRYWEGRFPQLKPLQRAGNRRYYRPEDVALLRRIQGLLDRDGYSIRGVQQLLAGKTVTDPASATDRKPIAGPASPEDRPVPDITPALHDALLEIRMLLRDALRNDDLR